MGHYLSLVWHNACTGSFDNFFIWAAFARTSRGNLVFLFVFFVFRMQVQILAHANTQIQIALHGTPCFLSFMTCRIKFKMSSSSGSAFYMAATSFYPPNNFHQHPHHHQHHQPQLIFVSNTMVPVTALAYFFQVGDFFQERTQRDCFKQSLFREYKH